MGLEFYNVEDTGEILFIINDKNFSSLEKNIISLFNEKYNNLIDLYSDFRLYENHLKYLSELLNNIEKRTPIEDDFLDNINHCLNNKLVLLVKGN
ncbi:MAG: hypothetical protein E2604_14420 [Flavobacterium sp.]|nr:hypothetical protein [Flavobacterium sp.]